MIKRLLLALITFYFFNSGHAQGNFPENGPLFIDTVVPRIDITINPDTLAWIYANVYSDTEFRAKFVFDNGINRDTIDPVGFRLRGNTSRVSKKKSFNISFKKFISGGKLYGLEKLNLNGEHNDPSIMRAKIMWDIMRKWEIPAPRANHVRVYINGNYYGLYLNVEHIDEEFVMNRFGNKDGNLYKCTYPADLVYKGNDPNLYKFLSGDTRAYELKINESIDDYTDLANFIDKLNRTANDNLACSLDEVFNIYDYLKVIAVDIFCGNWDGAIYNKNNFYLYHNTKTNKFEYIPYDVDNTFGIDWFGIDWGKINMYSWQPGGTQYRPIYNRILNESKLRRQFSYYAYQLINNSINIEELMQSIENRKNMIAPYVLIDSYYTKDYGFYYSDFLNSFTSAFGRHVKYGIYPYLQTRKESMNQQVELFTMMPVIKYIAHQRGENQSISFKAKVEVAVAPAKVYILYAVDNYSFMQKEMLLMNDGFYSYTLDGVGLNHKVSYQIKVLDAIQQEQILPCNPAVSNASSSDIRLYINEFMASNLNTITDEYGNSSDWIEIYNAEEQSVYLGDMYLTDNLNIPNKWQMPDIYINPGGFELFWASGDSNSGPYHTNFKLNKDTESIGIFNKDQLKVDALDYLAQTTDISYGRYTNGTANWEFFNTPTPRASNISNSITGLPVFSNDDKLIVYPNPSSGAFIYLNKQIDCKVYNSSGRLMFEGNQIKSISISDFASGLYIIVDQNQTKTRFVVL
jgi:spore coat protein CotH